jgi:transcriptional regulator with XRE-family HTH domain
MIRKASVERLGIDLDWISHWENGDALPNLLNLVRLSMLYEISIEKFFADLVKADHEGGADLVQVTRHRPSNFG